MSITNIVAISDTHGMHRMVSVPDADVLIHAGDFCRHGRRDEVEDFANWLKSLPHRNKIVTAGNHDAWVAKHPGEARALFADFGVKLLLDEEIIINGLKLWGSPITPRFGRWAFMMDRGEELFRHWQKIPADAHVIITHGPAYGSGDRVPPYRHGLPKHAGCLDLLNRLREIQQETSWRFPFVHVFGHIHDGYGVCGSDQFGGLRFINAATCNEAYEPVNRPITFSLGSI